MNTRNTVLAAGLLIVLIIVYLLTSGGPVSTKQVKTDQFQFSGDQTMVIEITNPEDTLRFKRSGQDWILDDYEADSNRVNTLLSDFSELAVDRLVTSNPDNHSRYEVDDDATHILVSTADGNTQLSLLIGKQGSNYSETLVRVPDEDEVYAVSTSLSRYRSAKRSGYWDRTITQFDVNSIEMVSFKGDLNFSISNDMGKWSLDDVEVDAQKVTDMLRPLGNMRGTNFVDDLSTGVLKQSIEIQLLNGVTTVLEFYFVDENSSIYQVKVSDKAKIFEFSKASLNRYDKGPDDLQPEA